MLGPWLTVVKQEMARLNINILGISELKCMGMGEFNSNDHYFNDYGQESLSRNGMALIINESLKCNTSVQSQKKKKKKQKKQNYVSSFLR